MLADHNQSEGENEARVVKVVGNYLVGPTIGKGYFARVKRVEDQYRQVYAMKCFDKERISRNTHTLNQVQNEINALRLCSHPAIAKFHEVLEVEKSFYLIMEYIPHGELFDYIKNKGRLTEPEAVYMGKQIISALEYCHTLGIAHRDVKPENVLIDERGNVKLVDFGLCSFFHQTHDAVTPNMDAPELESMGNSAIGPQNKLLNTQCGSPHYAAPEVLLGIPYDGALADIWSFGVLLYAMVTGSLPFTARLIPQLVQKIVAGVYRMPSFLSPLCKHLLSGILRVNPRDRMSMEEIMKHPWWVKTEKWVPVISPTASSNIAAPINEENIKSYLWNAARQVYLGENEQRNADTNVECQTCGKSLRPRTDSKGMIVLTGTNEDLCQCGKSSKDKAKSENPDADDGDDESEQKGHYMQLPKLFSDDQHELDGAPAAAQLSRISEDIDDKLRATALLQQKPIDFKRTVPSQREFDLQTACEAGDLKKVREIVFNRQCPQLIDKDTADSMTGSVPHGVCMCPDSPHRLDLRVGGIDNWTALHYAARLGNHDIVEELILSCLPLDINARTRNNWTPLMFAAYRGHAKVVDILLNYRADIHVTSTDGKTAIFLAREHNYTDISQTLTQASSIRLMKNLQADNNQQQNGSQTRLSLQSDLFDAAEQGDLHKLRKLWELSVQAHQMSSADDEDVKVDFLAKGLDNWTLIHFAGRRGHYDAILFIISQLYRECGARAVLQLINSPSKSGWTPLMMAADRGHVKVAEFLIACGADLDTVSKDNETLSNIIKLLDGPSGRQLTAFVQKSRKEREDAQWK